MNDCFDEIDKRRMLKYGGKHSTEEYSKFDIEEYSHARETTHKERKQPYEIMSFEDGTKYLYDDPLVKLIRRKRKPEFGEGKLIIKTMADRKQLAIEVKSEIPFSLEKAEKNDYRYFIEASTAVDNSINRTRRLNRGKIWE